jgi:phosphate transport system substrate-binding protein
MHLITKKRSLLLLLSILALIIPLVIAGCSSSEQTITEAGSTTVQPLAEKCAQVFMSENPDISITIQGGGSSVGVKSANDGTVDIGAASRELKDSEPALVKHLLAKDGIAIACHPSNSVTGLTKEQVKEIYAGNITKWSDVGGPDEDIHVVAREEGSGTRAAFEEMVMGEETLITETAILQPSNGALRTTVASDPMAIGFLSFGYLDSSVKSISVDGVEGTKENALNGSYPIVRPLYFLTKEQPAGIVKEFIDFCLSTDGQKIAEDEGYIPVK